MKRLSWQRRRRLKRQGWAWLLVGLFVCISSTAWWFRSLTSNSPSVAIRATATEIRATTTVMEPTITPMPTRASYDRDAYIEDLRSGMAIFVDQGLGNIGVTDRDGEERTAGINYTPSDAPFEAQLMDVFDALDATIRLHRLDLDAATVYIWANEDLMIGRVTVQVSDIAAWHDEELTDQEFLARWDIVDLTATRAARATAVTWTPAP